MSPPIDPDSAPICPAGLQASSTFTVFTSVQEKNPSFVRHHATSLRHCPPSRAVITQELSDLVMHTLHVFLHVGLYTSLFTHLQTTRHRICQNFSTWIRPSCKMIRSVPALMLRDIPWNNYLESVSGHHHRMGSIAQKYCYKCYATGWILALCLPKRLHLQRGNHTAAAKKKL